MTQSPISYLSNRHHPVITQTLETLCVMVRHEPRGDPYVEQTSLKVSSVAPVDHTKPERTRRWRGNKKPWIWLSLSSCVTSIQISAFALTLCFHCDQMNREHFSSHFPNEEATECQGSSSILHHTFGISAGASYEATHICHQHPILHS